MGANLLFGGDLNDQFFFWKDFLVTNIKQGTIPFWNPYSFSGTPFLAHPSVAAFYPLNLIYFLFPLNIAFSVYIFLHVVLAGIFMYFFTRKYVDRLAALAGSVIFSLSGVMAARIYSGHIDIISTIIWIPAVFGSVITALKTYKKKDIAIAVVFLTLQILAGYQAVVIFTLELIFIYEIVITFLMSFPRKRESQRIKWIPDQVGNDARIKKIVLLIFIVVSSYGLSAVQWLATAELVRNSIRGNGLPYETLTWGSYTFDQFLTFINPFRYGNPFPENYTYTGPGPNFFELTYFSGIVPVLLFFYFIFQKLRTFAEKKKFDGKSLGLIAALVFFLILSMGGNTPFHHLMYLVNPAYRMFRIPSQHLIVAVFLIAFIVSLSLGSIKNKSLKLIILVFILLELVNFDRNFIRFGPLPTQNFDTKLISTLQNDKGLFRVLPDYSVVSGVRKSWDFESSLYYKIQSTSGYNPILLANYYHYIDLLNKNYTSSIREYNVEIPPPNPSAPEINFLNIKYVLADKNYDAIKDSFASNYNLILEGDNYRLYENANFSPRFSLDCAREEKVEVKNYKINDIKLQANAPCSGYLSTSEVYYPGWKASVDGKEVPIYRTNTAFRSINLPAGKHDVEFYYQPTIYYLGGLISLSSLIGGIFLMKKYY